ncbi:uncharacterized protein VTP21DRAFT_11027 [Calcarisporiella thermophila]|uniref:uncharacterized protein n=1 Tax=Calcarisporiella thermophila TaxID=911321 RepID=UPI003742567C
MFPHYRPPPNTLSFSAFHDAHFNDQCRQIFTSFLHPHMLGLNLRRENLYEENVIDEEYYEEEYYEEEYLEEQNDDWEEEEAGAEEVLDWEHEQILEEEEVEEEEEAELVMTQEAIAFFALSEERRRQREAEQRNQNIQEGEEEDDTEDVKDIEPELTEPPSTALVVSPYNVEKYREIYGDAFHSVASLEAVVNSGYERFCRGGDAVLWPVLPLRLC